MFPAVRRPKGASVVFGVLILGMSGLWPSLSAQSLAPGGFVEAADVTTGRAPLTAAQIASFMPARGVFTFPAPYGTQGVRLTNSSDCAGGADCINPVGYSYWRNINNHAGSNTMYIFLGSDRNKGGAGPILLTYDKTTGATNNLGALFPSSSPYGWATGEGWYFSATQATKLYVNSGAVLSRYDVVTHSLQPVFDVSTQYGTDKYLWQLHSSNDDRMHSFTLRENVNYTTLGCGIYNEATAQYQYFAARGTFDECQIDKSGRYLMIKENVDGVAGEDNVIEDLQTGVERIYYDQQGAGGHSDNGFGYEVAEDNYANNAGSLKIFRFDQNQSDLSNGNGTQVWHSTDWNIGMTHVAHANAVANTPISQQHACVSNANRLSIPRANEVLCFRLDGSQRAVVVAPVLTDLNAAGGGAYDYDKAPKGNLDVTGEYFIWTANMGAGRLDAFLVRVPTQLIPGGGGTDTTPPAVAITAPGGGSVLGAVTISANATDNVGVTSVQFKLDGANLGAPLTAAPYSATWATAATPNGMRTLTAEARDAAGNLTVSAPITVKVANTLPDTVAPFVSVTTPAAGSTANGSITISANATDNVGVASVQFKLDGANLGAALTAAPYSTTWNTTTAPGGAHTLVAEARDAAGNVALSTVVNVTVSNTPPRGERRRGGSIRSDDLRANSLEKDPGIAWPPQ